MEALDLTQEQEHGQEDVDGPVIEIGGADNEGVDALVTELEATADSFRVSGFKCVTCSLSHGHDTDKHRASDSFNVTHEQAADMDMNPNCHCGLSDLAHNSGKYGITDAPTPSEAANKAPVPDEVQQSLRS